MVVFGRGSPLRPRGSDADPRGKAASAAAAAGMSRPSAFLTFVGNFPMRFDAPGRVAMLTNAGVTGFDIINLADHLGRVPERGASKLTRRLLW